MAGQVATAASAIAGGLNKAQNGDEHTGLGQTSRAAGVASSAHQSHKAWRQKDYAGAAQASESGATQIFGEAQQQRQLEQGVQSLGMGPQRGGGTSAQSTPASAPTSPTDQTNAPPPTAPSPPGPSSGTPPDSADNGSQSESPSPVEGDKDQTPKSTHAPAARSTTAQSGDSISSLIGTSDPDAIGQFMRVNGLTDSKIKAGQTYTLPDDNSTQDTDRKLGQNTLDADNRRVQGQQAKSAQLIHDTFNQAAETSDGAPDHEARDRYQPDQLDHKDKAPRVVDQAKAGVAIPPDLAMNSPRRDMGQNNVGKKVPLFDYFSVNVGFYVGGGGFSINLHDGGLFGQWALGRSYPAYGLKPGLTMVGGNIINGYGAHDTAAFLAGGSAQVGHFAPIPIAPIVGVGGGLNHSYGGKTAVEAGISIPSGTGVSPVGYGFEVKRKDGN